MIDLFKARLAAIEGGELPAEAAYDSKIVARRGRLVSFVGVFDASLLQRFAIRCARHVLPLFERCYPEDDRPRRSVKVTERYLEGKATGDELAVAWRAARAAAADAARRAERIWQDRVPLAMLHAQQRRGES